MLNVSLGREARPARILCLGSHSDDLEIGCGGTVLKLIAGQHETSAFAGSCSAPTGQRAVEAGTARRSSSRVRRRGRSRSTSSGTAFFLTVARLSRNGSKSSNASALPDLIFTHYRDDRHQDHRLISDLTWNTYRDHFILEYEIPKYDGDLGIPNVFVHLDEATCRRKVGWIIECFQTQQNRHWFSEDTFLSLLRLRGIESASPTTYAEGFFCRKAVLNPAAGG